jgi:hypothetical protein
MPPGNGASAGPLRHDDGRLPRLTAAHRPELAGRKT